MSERVQDWVRRLREATVDTKGLPTVLVPFALFEGEAIPPGTFELLSETHVLLLGYLELPEQTPPGQAQMQFEERGEQLLDDLAARFVEAGAAVDSLLSFTHDARSTIERVARERECDARLVLNQLTHVEDVLLAVTPELEVDHVLAFVAAVFLGHEPRIQLVDAGESVQPADVERVRRTLVSVGFDGDRISVFAPEADAPVARIVEAAATADVVVLPEPRRGIQSFFLGETPTRIAMQYVGPVLVVYPRAIEPDETDESN